MNKYINRKCNHAHKTTSCGIGLKKIISGSWRNLFRELLNGITDNVINWFT